MAYTINEYHGNYNIQTRTDAVKYIVVHYVGSGTSAHGSALANCRYFAGGNRNASAHYFIDDGSIWEYADPKYYSTWHCGDGYGRYGITNQNSIGIEVCMNYDQPFTDAEISRLTWLVQKLMGAYGVPANRVVRHHDASGKFCPLYYTNRPHEWEKLHAQITGGKVEEETAPSAPATPASRLEVDGIWGAATTLALQNYLNAPYKDGVISRQHYSNKQYLAACVGGWEFGSSTQGSQTIELLQKKLGVTADGLMGPNTVRALQNYLGTYADGYLDYPSPCVMELQRRLNAGTF